MLIGLHVQIHAQYGERGRLEIDQPFEQLCGSGFTGERILGVDWFSGSRHGFGQLTRLLQHAECQTGTQLTKRAPLCGDSETRTLKGPGEATWASRRAVLTSLREPPSRSIGHFQQVHATAPLTRRTKSSSSDYWECTPLRGTVKLRLTAKSTL